MKVAIVAVGALARYLAESLIAEGHEVVAVSRSKKDWLDELGIAQHTTDYSVASLTELLDDFGAAGLERLGLVAGGVSRHSADVPIWVLEKGAGHRTTLIASGTEDDDDLGHFG
ncbi:hypothetical protein NLG97_g5728 [Lecanicillium saksenae]|uniref:Uncharacterized protein n=1 Tax=Lecanicillium saksenae TaxID=468837 RepID=A0ACC1QT07_9HYPO|nr:hypothetical protein NLG97_g5728 [Lecanicillium saksenae]